MTVEPRLNQNPTHTRHGSNIGQPLTRREGVLKVTGAARYGVAYLVRPDCAVTAATVVRGRWRSSAAGFRPGTRNATGPTCRRCGQFGGGADGGLHHQSRQRRGGAPGLGRPVGL